MVQVARRAQGEFQEAASTSRPQSGRELGPCVSEPTPVWIEVNLGAIQHNLGEIRRFIGPHVQTLAVVKANAYGHGLAPVAQALVEAEVEFLGVASVREGVALRQYGLNSRILVLGQILPEEAPLVIQHRLTQAIGDLAIAKVLSRTVIALEKPARVHLKVDTGMGRYGVWFEEAVGLVRQLVQLPGVKVEGIFTHLATAGQDPQTAEQQLSRFSHVISRLRRADLPMGLIHTANSVGLIKFPEAHRDLVRTGLLIYGVSPLREGRVPMNLRPALSLKSRVRFLKTIPAGETISYGGTFRADRPTKVATIPVGYAHGYTRALSNKAELLVRGSRAPIIGRITMEDLMAGVTDIPNVQVGDEVVLIGQQGRQSITASELAVHARTIPYEILAGLSPSIPRRYLKATL